MALGILVDINIEPYSPEAERFYDLGRAALASASCLENTTVGAVQALVSLKETCISGYINCGPLQHLMAYYNQMTDKKSGPAATWALNGLAFKLAHRVSIIQNSFRD